MFVYQLGAVVGEKVLAEGLIRYYNTCRFKHPEPIDFERVMEKESGLELDWYFDEWINTTRTLDYGIRSVLAVNGDLRVEVERIGEQLMPVDVRVERRDGSSASYHIPLSLQRGAKEAGSEMHAFTVLAPWQWTDQSYVFTVPGPIASVKAIVLDPLNRTAEIDVTNNIVSFPDGVEGFLKP
jgi:hypothetical protein